MKAWLRRPGGITSRLLAIAILPATLLFLAVSAAMYVGTFNDVRRDVSERGRLIAQALAQNSPYGLVSGNLDYVQATMRQLVDNDRSIVCIELLDAQGRKQAGHCKDGRRETALQSFEAPVNIESMGSTDLLDPYAPEPTKQVRHLGMVKVTMSGAPIFAARRGALYLAQLSVLAVSVASSLFAWRLTRRLRQTFAALLTALRAVRRGDFDVSLDVNAPDELGEMQRTVVQMTDSLRTARDNLEGQVRSRTRALHDALDQIREVDAERRRLISHSNALIEEDRRRLAVEIHDHLGASLISVRLQASALAAHAESEQQGELARSAQRIADTVQALYISSRDIIKSLRPEVLDTLGLAGAIEELVGGLDRNHHGCRFHLSVPTTLPPLRSEVAMQVYRVAQESLTNIIKHAEASEAWVTLTADDPAGTLRLEVRDNGKGLPPAAQRQAGLGLIGMRERVASMGGHWSMQSKPGEGTQIVIWLPLTGPQA